MSSGSRSSQRLLVTVTVWLLTLAFFYRNLEAVGGGIQSRDGSPQTAAFNPLDPEWPVVKPIVAPLLSGMNFNSSNYQLTMAKADLSSLRVIIHNRWNDKPGGAEALLQLTLAFHSWMPNQTYAQGRTDARIIKGHWLDWYPEINRLNVVHEQQLRVDIADRKVFRRGDIYIIPELFNCPKHLVEMGVHVFIWKLGAVGNHGSFSGQKNNMQLGCTYLSHSHWLANAEELEIPEERIFLPYMTPAKSQKGDITNVRRENLIIVNGHDPSSPDGEAVKNYCDGKDCKVTILKGFNTKQLLDLYQRAKIVVGFCMRGCERAPIEAVLAGVVLVSNNCLAGQDRHDFPIPRENIVAANNTVEDVFGRILANFEEEQNKMGNMRALYQMIGPDTLAKQTQGFIYNFWGMVGHNSTASLG